MPACPSCGAEYTEADVKCGTCGANVSSTGVNRLIGTTVLGQYRIVDVLGQGGMSVVYRGKHSLTEQDVALKVLPPELAAYSQVKSRFLEEAKALAQLDHPNIVHLYNFGQENGSFVLAMQFVHGQTWEKLILDSEGQDWPTATRIAVDVLRGLEFAHGRGVVHRDMKPSNVLVRDDDGTATVMDFGIAKMTTSTRLTATGQTMGTVRYMSPEQVRGQEVDARSDIYSVGATLYEALVGDTPFDGNTHFEIMSKHLTEQPQPLAARGVRVPAVLEAAVMRSLAKKVDDRFATARDFRKELEEALKDANDGFAETQRLARDTVARARSGVVASDPAVVVPPPVTAPATPAVKAAAAAGSGQGTGLADELEPEARRPIERRLRWLWIGSGLLVLAAGAAVLWRIRRADPAAPATAAPPGPPTLTLPNLVWKAEAPPSDGLGQVRVVSSSRWQADDVVAAGRKVRAALAPILAARGLAGPPREPAVALVVVPQEVLCSPGVLDSQVGDCAALGSYYRLREKTLLVVDTEDRAALEARLAEGLGEVACLYNEITPCFVPELQAALAGK